MRNPYKFLCMALLAVFTTLVGLHSNSLGAQNTDLSQDAHQEVDLNVGELVSWGSTLT